jgi:2-polyprenyl-3-methyl-5-hydroxy-6-metoxy-1,4-benzoquinol methylase
MTVSAEERLRAFRARSLDYLRLGHDRMAAVRFVVDAAGELQGPALDVGTGKGLLAIELAARGLEVVTIDVDAQERELAMLLAGEAGVAARITYDTGDAADLPYADGRFGCVATMNVLHHLAESQSTSVLREMARVTSPGGVIVVADFDEDGFELVSSVHRTEGHVHLRSGVTVAGAVQELETLGLVCLNQRNGWQHDVAVLRRKTGPS